MTELSIEMDRCVLTIGIAALGLQAAFGADAPEACRKLWNDAVGSRSAVSTGVIV